MRAASHAVGQSRRATAASALWTRTDDEVVKKVQAHVEAKHPDLIGKLSKSDILAMAEEV